MRAEVARPLALAAAALGAAAVLAARAPAPATSDAASALGGARTVVVGSLFLRAEALRRAGRFDELPALYRRVLELDPTSSSAVDHLAGVLAYDLRTTAPTEAGRVRWWAEADARVREALARAPRDPVLLTRCADLLLVAPALDPAVAAAGRDAGRDLDLEGLRAAAAAAAETADVPRVGRLHLELVARHAPRVAAERLAAHAPGTDEALRLGRTVLAARAAPLLELYLDPGPDAPPAAVVLDVGLDAVRRVAEALGATPPRPDEARRVVDAYARAVGRPDVVAALRRGVR